MADIARTLTTIITIKGWNEQKLGTAIGVSQSTISKWISGKQSPNQKYWVKVEEILANDPRLAHLLPETRPATIPEFDAEFYAAWLKLSPRERRSFVRQVKTQAADELA